MGKGKIIPVSDFDNCIENCASCCFYCCLGYFYVGLGIAKIVIGSINIYSCGLQYLVPIYLIVSAVCPALFAGWTLQDPESGAMANWAFVIALFGSVFNLVWQICGSVWVYPTFATINSSSFIPCESNSSSTDDVKCSDKDCPQSLVNFAFGIVTFDWIILGIWAVFVARRIISLFQRY